VLLGTDKVYKEKLSEPLISDSAGVTTGWVSHAEMGSHAKSAMTINTRCDFVIVDVDWA